MGPKPFKPCGNKQIKKNPGEIVKKIFQRRMLLKKILQKNFKKKFISKKLKKKLNWFCDLFEDRKWLLNEIFINRTSLTKISCLNLKI